MPENPKLQSGRPNLKQSISASKQRKHEHKTSDVSRETFQSCEEIKFDFKSSQSRDKKKNLSSKYIFPPTLAKNSLLCLSQKNDPNVPNLLYQDIANYVFQTIFTIEMVVKIISLGFVLEKNTYLRSVWNILDFIVVVMGWISLLFQSSNVSAIRVIRILRPLRTISSIPSMRNLVQSILKSLPTMFDAFLLFIFFLIITGTIATQLFAGLLQSRCVDSNNNIVTDDFGNEVFCSESQECDQQYQCVKMDNPDYGVSSFDNILVSDLNIFIIITMEGWTNLMYYIRHATGTYVYDLFFHFIVIIGTFFIINLMVAIQFNYLSASFNEPSKSNDLCPLSAKSPHIISAPDSTPRLMIKQQYKKKELKAPSKLQRCFKSFRDCRNSENYQKLKKTKICSCYQMISSKLFLLVNNKIFNIVVIILILINTIFMAMNHYQMNSTFQQITQQGNLALTVVFTLEMTLKLIAYGIIDYVKDGFNIFDAIVVAIGLLEFADVNSQAITVLRAFRLMRIFKIVRSWTNLRRLLQTVLKSLKSIANLAMLMFLFIFIYVLIGMQFLAFSEPPPPEDQFRYSFNSFIDGLILVFDLTTAENWNSILYYYIHKFGWEVSLYFLSAILIGNTMLLNLFLAVLLNFIQDNLDPDTEDAQHKQLEGSEPEKKIELSQIKELQDESGINYCPVNRIEQNYGFGDTVAQFTKPKQSSDKDLPRFKQLRPTLKLKTQDRNDIFQRKLSSRMDLVQFMTVYGSPTTANKLKKESATPRSMQQIQQLEKPKTLTRRQSFNSYQMSGSSLYMFDKKSNLRQKLYRFIRHQYIENFIIHLISLNCLIMAYDQPAYTSDYFQNTIKVIDYVITVIFIIEAIIKIVVLGFAFGKGSYLRNSWNILDFLIIIIAIIQIIIDQIPGVNDSIVGVIRSLRSFRILRIIAQNKGLKNVVGSLVVSIPSLFNVILISLLFLFVFGILGIQIFAGEMGYCTDSTIDNLINCIGNYTNDSNQTFSREWKVEFNNYDDIFYSTMTFFEVTTLEAWPDILFKTIDTQGPDMGPSYNNRPYLIFLFIGYIFITTFFVFNLFVSVIVDNFNEEMKKKEGMHDLTDKQRAQIRLQIHMAQTPLKLTFTAPKNNSFRKQFYKLVTNPKFDYFIFIVIALNTITLCIDFYDKPTLFGQIIDILNFIFIGIFIIEAISKLIGIGIKLYFRDSWNKFDFGVVILSLFALDENLLPIKANVLRIIRVARLLRLVRALKGLKKLLKALWLALQNIGNVVIVLFIIFFIFSISGMSLFGQIVKGDSQINSDANFRTFYMSITTLFRGSTGECWNYIMHDGYYEVGVSSVIYWILFQLVSKYIFLNIFIAVVFESLDDVNANDEEEKLTKVKKKDVKLFAEVWSKFCPHKEKYMNIYQFCAFLQELPPPLGYQGKYLQGHELIRMIKEFNLKIHLRGTDKLEGMVYFPEVLWCLVFQVEDVDDKVLKNKQVKKSINIYKKKFRGLGKDNILKDLSNRMFQRKQGSFDISAHEYLCAKRIVKHWIQFRKDPNRNKLSLFGIIRQAQVAQRTVKRKETAKFVFKTSSMSLSRSLEEKDQFKLSFEKESYALNTSQINNNDQSIKGKVSKQERLKIDWKIEVEELKDNDVKVEQSEEVIRLVDEYGRSLLNKDEEEDELLEINEKRLVTGGQKELINQIIQNDSFGFKLTDNRKNRLMKSARRKQELYRQEQALIMEIEEEQLQQQHKKSILNDAELKMIENEIYKNLQRINVKQRYTVRQSYYIRSNSYDQPRNSHYSRSNNQSMLLPQQNPVVNQNPFFLGPTKYEGLRTENTPHISSQKSSSQERLDQLRLGEIDKSVSGRKRIQPRQRDSSSL